MAGALALAQDPIAPYSASEPPAARAAASLAASTKASPPGLLTTGEKSDWNETAPYAEAVEISHRLERASRFVRVLDIGVTPEGRTMIALVVSKDRAFTPQAAARTGKGIMLIQSGIHAGEIEGKDPALMQVRDMVVARKYVAWLDRMIVVIIPVFNVAGMNISARTTGPARTGRNPPSLRSGNVGSVPGFTCVTALWAGTCHNNGEAKIMNWDQMEGKWKQMKGVVRKQWGKLTDDDLEFMAGSKDQFVGRLQERYGIKKEEAQKQADEWLQAQAEDKSKATKHRSGGGA